MNALQAPSLARDFEAGASRSLGGVTTKITVGPPVLTINRGSTFMVTDYRGEIDSTRSHGVFADDTRFLSRHQLRVNGELWERVSSATVTSHSARLYLTNPRLPQAFGSQAELAAQTLYLTIDRNVDEGIEEKFELTNHGRDPAAVVLAITLDSDFADLFEVRADQIKQRLALLTRWDEDRATLTTTYRNADYLRRFSYELESNNAPATYANGQIRIAIQLAGHESWQATGRMVLQHAEDPRTAHTRAPSNAGHEQMQARWLRSCTEIRTSTDDVQHVYERSVDDLGGLRLFDHDLGPDVWVPAAGVPWFVTLFGRDSLIASLQCMMVHAPFAEGALRLLAQHQATERNDWRDAQPGKIVHEVRHGELAHFNLVPHTRYYGTWDATPLYLVTLFQAWRWLGDRGLMEDLLPVAEGCLSWIDRWGDLDGDGFQEYQTYSEAGYENMGWKDAGDAVVYPDGAQVPQPKALCELQGYVYAAWRGMSEVYTALGDIDRGRELGKRAEHLKRRFNDAFWMEVEGTYAYGLDPDKRQIGSIVSNPGHCLWTGIVDDAKAGRLARRLIADDLWTGWGVRTLSKHNPAYDPFSYQRGSVWPHDNGIIAAGMKRYGYSEEAARVARGMFDAAAHFRDYRLPEVFAGLHREPDSFPVQYLGANIPQAWAAGSIFQLIQTMLGLQADAPNGRLEVEPTLPDWLPTLELRGLRVGRSDLDLRFWREGAQSRFEVLDQRGEPIDVCLTERSGGFGEADASL